MKVTVVDATEKPIDIISYAAGSSTRKDDVRYKRVERCILDRHSVHEFADVTFKIEGISRTCLAQLTRHRLASYCVAGDTVVRTGRGRKKTIEELYNMAEQYKNMTILRCVDESNGMISYDHFSNVYYTGDKEVYEVETSFGYKVKTTADHQFLCEDGQWRCLYELQIGDRVMVNGLPLYQDKEWLKQKYLDENLSQQEIGDLCGVGKDCIRKWVRQFNLQKPMGSWSVGKEPPNKGKTKENYYPMMKTSMKMKGRPPANPISGPNRSDWLGEKATDSSKRQRVYHHNQRTGICENCGFHGVTEFHHINKNLDEYTSEYIQELCVACHKAIHRQEIKERIIPNEIISITYIGVEPVYDISMAGDNHNFIGNGFVLHNCVESQRYNKYNLDSNDWYVIPHTIQEDVKKKQAFESAMNYAASQYEKMINDGIKPEDARFVLPEATKTSLHMKINARSLFNLFEQRRNPHAQWEIHELADAMMQALREYNEQWNQMMDIYLDYEKESLIK